MKLLVGLLVQLCQETFSYEFILWSIWKLQKCRFFPNFKRSRCCNVLTFLPFILLMLILSDNTIHERWGVTYVIKFLRNQHLFLVKVWRKRYILQFYTNLREWHFSYNFSEILQTSALLFCNLSVCFSNIFSYFRWYLKCHL